VYDISFFVFGVDTLFFLLFPVTREVPLCLTNSKMSRSASGGNRGEEGLDDVDSLDGRNPPVQHEQDHIHGNVIHQPVVMIPAAQYELFLTTVQRLAADNPAPRMPQLAVQPFNGSGEQSVLDFVVKLQDMKAYCRIPDQEFLNRYVPTMLEGLARAWFEDNCRNISWDLFIAKIKSRFSTVAKQERIKDKIYERRMGKNELVSVYIRDILDLNRQLNQRLSQHELVAIIHRGMRYSLRTMLRRATYGNVEELEADAESIQADMNKAVDERKADLLAEQQSFAAANPRPPEFNNRPSTGSGGNRTNRPLVCHRCQEVGHIASRCRAPAPVPRYEQTEQHNSGTGNARDLSTGARQRY